MAEVRRMCRVCRTKKAKSALTRWVVGPDGHPLRDETQRLPGRGFYTDTPECIERLTKMKVKP